MVDTIRTPHSELLITCSFREISRAVNKTVDTVVTLHFKLLITSPFREFSRPVGIRVFMFVMFLQGSRPARVQHNVEQYIQQ